MTRHNATWGVCGSASRRPRHRQKQRAGQAEASRTAPDASAGFPQAIPHSVIVWMRGTELHSSRSKRFTEGREGEGGIMNDSIIIEPPCPRILLRYENTTRSSLTTLNPGTGGDGAELLQHLPRTGFSDGARKCRHEAPRAWHNLALIHGATFSEISGLDYLRSGHQTWPSYFNYKNI